MRCDDPLRHVRPGTPVRRYEGFWQAGRQHGLGLYFKADGSARLAEWDSGKRVRWVPPRSHGTKATSIDASLEYLVLARAPVVCFDFDWFSPTGRDGATELAWPGIRRLDLWGCSGHSSTL